MSANVTVVDYGMGNLFSVERAFEHCGAEVHAARSVKAIESAERLVLPGVGAFADAMRELSRLGLVDALHAFAASGKPFLGICLGMQMMLESSEEFGRHAGLGLVAGEVRAIPTAGRHGTHKVPHIGWNAIHPVAADWSGGLLDGVAPGAAVYFVHSFTAFPTAAAARLADCDYDGCRISAVIRAGNLYGCQFHPEKSGETGLRILRNFLNLAPA